MSQTTNMRARPLALFAAAVAFGLLAVASTPAQQHRATRLGNPATRFAPPLASPADLRARFRDEKLRPDIVAILDQWGWKGDVEDLCHAATTTEIVEWKIPVGARLPFMSSRENGQPVTLRDVLWAGKEPAPAYAFQFTSRGRRYRCITPKACSNFYVEDLGPEWALKLAGTAPETVGLCDPIEMKLTVRNTGGAPLTQVRVANPLPAGLKMAGDESVSNFDAGTLQPGEAREFAFKAVASEPGTYRTRAMATSAQGANAEAATSTVVRAPRLALDCGAPGDALVGRPVEVCLTLRNEGDAADPSVTLSLPIPSGSTLTGSTEGSSAADGRLVWTFANFAPQASQRVCATFTLRQPGALAFAPAARGACAPPVQSQCATKVAGVAGVLVEVVDLEDPIEVGHEITYDIKVTNQGSATLTNIRLACTVPASQEYVSGTGATAVTAQERAVQMEVLPALEGKAVAAWRVITKAVAPDDSRFTVELTADQFKQPIVRHESTTLY